VALNTTLARKRRMELGLSLHQAATLIGVTHAALFRWEKGETEPRSSDTLQAWARVRGVEAGALLQGPEAEAVNH
jgi:transcriptional regulator with XRE-family HTH domain